MRSWLAKAFMVSILIAACPFASTGYAAEPSVQVNLDGQTLTFDVPPTIVDGRTLVPLRAIFQAFGLEVTFDGATQSITAMHNGTPISLIVGSTNTQIGTRTVSLDVPAQIIAGRTLVPLRFISEALGAAVTYDGSSRTVNIQRPAQFPGIDQPASSILTELLKANISITTDKGSSGSGFIVDSNGVVVTAYHVIEDAESATVKLADGREYPVEGLLSTAPELNLAVLKVTATGLPIMPLGDAEAVKVADQVVVLGNPPGPDSKVAKGLIIAKGIRRRVASAPTFELRTSISPNGSGGALVNTEGQVIGMVVSLIKEGQQLNFAVPIDQLAPLLTPASVKPLAQVGGATVAEFQARDRAATAKHNEFVELHDLLADQSYCNMESVGLDHQYMAEMEPLVDDLIKAAPPGRWAAGHRASVKFHVIELIYRSVRSEAFWTCQFGDAYGDEAALQMLDYMLGPGETWRNISNEQLSADLTPTDGMGGTPVSTFAARGDVLFDRMTEFQEHPAMQPDSDVSDQERADFALYFFNELEPLVDGFISASPPGKWADGHAVIAKYSVGQLVYFSVWHQAFSAGAQGNENAIPQMYEGLGMFSKIMTRWESDLDAIIQESN